MLAKLLKALHSDAGPWSLAFGVMLGMIFGLTPLFKLHNLLILFIVLFFRVNLTTFIVSWGLFSALAYALDPIMIGIGERMLTSESLQGIWTAFYNTYIGRGSQFYHTLTMGSLVVSLTLAPVALFASRFVIINYRDHIMTRVEKWRVIEVLKGSRVYHIYQNMGG